MSGICGIIEPACLPDGEQRINHMLDAMSHRGRDGKGTAHPTENVFLGCVHQNDIDTQAHALQPMEDPDTGNLLLFDGEIYNFKELQSELTHHGIAFVTGSDAEVLLMAYSFWGVSCLHKLRGVFAFAIWNAKERKLFAARDAMGVMPFYYYRDGLRFVFASEVRTLLASGIVPKELDVTALDSMLAFGSVQEPFTLLQGVHSLPPGCYFELRSREIFSCMPFTHEEYIPYTIPQKDIAELLHQSLMASVSMQSFADVPKCMLFDGSLNSIVLSTLLHDAKVDIKSFILHWNGQPLVPELAPLAQQLGIECHPLELDDASIRRLFNTALDCYDQPSIGGIGTWFAARQLAEQGIHVALSCLGSKSLFASGDDYAIPLKLYRGARMLRRLPNPILNMAKLLWTSDQARKFIHLGQTEFPPYFFYRELISHDVRAAILGNNPKIQPKWLKLMTANLNYQEFAKDDFNQITYLELTTFIRSTLLRNADQMGMANGIEIRAPFLDSIIINIILKVPGMLKRNSKTPNTLLLNAANLQNRMLSHIPPAPPWPLEKYMNDLCHKEIDELFHVPPMACMKSVAIVNLWNRYKAGQGNWKQIWNIFSALRWIQKYIGN